MTAGRRSLLDDNAISEGLNGLDWERDGQSLMRTRDFSTFADAIAFVGRVAKVAESMDHHPDIDVRYRRVTLRVTTHSAGGITPMDLEFAERIDRLA
jgi:4a-hydroxytetrahydrobiopterin dehydratase